MRGKVIYSGEPLPTAPRVKDPELAAFFRKLLDYLRRLTAKLDQGTGGNTPASRIQSFAARFSTDQNIADVYAAIIWEDEIHVDTCFDHVEDSSRVQVLCDGVYLVCVDLEISSDATFPVEVDLRVIYEGNIGILTYGYGSISSAGTLSRSIPLTLRAGAEIQVQAKQASTTQQAVLRRGSRITVVKLADGGAWVPPGCVDPCAETFSICWWNSCTTLSVTMTAKCLGSDGVCSTIVGTSTHTKLFTRNADPTPGTAEFELDEAGEISTIQVSESGGNITYSWNIATGHQPGWNVAGGASDCFIANPLNVYTFDPVNTGTAGVDPHVTTLEVTPPTANEFCGTTPTEPCEHHVWEMLRIQVNSECEENPIETPCDGIIVYDGYCVVDPEDP